MKNKLMIMKEKIILGKRLVVESVFNILKNYFNLEHSKHRSISNAYIYLISTLISYCINDSKLFINI